MKVEFIELDVSREDSIKNAVNKILSSTGKIDVLVNNAGILTEGFIEETSLEDMREVFETNFFGPVALIKAILPSMRTRRAGRIINILSMGAIIPQPSIGSYCASKGALGIFSESLQIELAGEGGICIWHLSWNI